MKVLNQIHAKIYVLIGEQEFPVRGRRKAVILDGFAGKSWPIAGSCGQVATESNAGDLIDNLPTNVTFLKFYKLNQFIFSRSNPTWDSNGFKLTFQL